MATKKPNTQQPSSDRKKSYEAPKILCREPLEAMAVVCGKADPGSCPLGPINS